MSVNDPDSCTLHNGRIYTVDAADSVAEALAIRGGEIAGVRNALRDMLEWRGRSIRVVDLGGRTVVPGFVDAHPHLDDVGLRMVLPSFDNPKSIDEVLKTVKGEVAKRETRRMDRLQSDSRESRRLSPIQKCSVGAVGRRGMTSTRSRPTIPSTSSRS